MSVKELHEFCQAISEDEELQDVLKKLGGDNAIRQFMTLGRHRGFHFTEDETHEMFRALALKNLEDSGQEVTDEDRFRSIARVIFKPPKSAEEEAKKKSSEVMDINTIYCNIYI